MFYLGQKACSQMWNAVGWRFHQRKQELFKHSQRIVLSCGSDSELQNESTGSQSQLNVHDAIRLIGQTESWEGETCPRNCKGES